MKVLVIDDELWTRTVTVRALAFGGRTDVIEAANGTDGIEVAKRERPDCVLLDVVLPDCDGPAVLDQLRAFDSGSPTVVFVTTLIDERQRQELIDRGADAVLAKPVDLLSLQDTLARIVAARAASSTML